MNEQKLIDTAGCKGDIHVVVFGYQTLRAEIDEPMAGRSES
jgi:hypothetical protein